MYPMNFHISTRTYFSSYFSTSSIPFLTFQSPDGCPRPIVQGQSVLLSVAILSKDTPSLICYERLPRNLTQYLQQSLNKTPTQTMHKCEGKTIKFTIDLHCFIPHKMGILMIPGLASLSHDSFLQTRFSHHHVSPNFKF